MTYYIKGGSRYSDVQGNPKVWVCLMLGGFPDADYLLTDWLNLDDKGHETTQDPFWRMGGSAGGAKEFELGLWNDFRIKFETTGITYWDGDSWNDLLTGGGVGGNLDDLDDVVITGTPAEDEVLAWDTGTTKWINQTAGEAGLSLSGHGHGQLHDESHSLSSHSSEAHNELTGYNDETDVKHLTDAQLGALHSIYILEQHNNTKHSTNYHSESDGTGAVTVHSGITDAGSGIIISTGERNNLHVIYSLEQHNNDHHSTNYEVANANIQSHVSSPVTDAHHARYTNGEVDARIVVQNIDPAGTIDIAIDALILTHTNLVNPHQTKLDDIVNPGGDKEFNFANKHLHFKWVAPASGAHEGAFEIEASGAFSGDLIHIHQHTGNVGANTYMVFIECEDDDASCLHLEHGGDSLDFGAGGLLVGADARITEFDTSPLANSDTKVPTNTTVKEYVDLLKEQSAAFPGSPVEGDFHYDEDDDSLYRYNGEAEAWIEVGGIGLISGENDVNKAYVNAMNWGYSLNAPERTSVAGGYALLKQTTLTVDMPVLNISWEDKADNASFVCYTKVYVNEVAISDAYTIWRSTYAKQTYTLTGLSIGDRVQIYGSTPSTHGVYAKNLVLGEIGTIHASY